MNFNSRVFRMASALTIVGIIASQIPTRSSVSLAADDGCPKSSNNAGTIALAVGGAAVLAKVAPGIIGIGGKGGIQSLKSLTDTIASNPDLSEAKKIIDNSGLGSELNESTKDLVLPDNKAIKKETTPEQLELLQSPSGAEAARSWVMAHQTEYNPSLEVLFTFPGIDGREDVEVRSSLLASVTRTLNGALVIYTLLS